MARRVGEGWWVMNPYNRDSWVESLQPGMSSWKTNYLRALLAMFCQNLAVVGAMQAMFDVGWVSGLSEENGCDFWQPNVDGKAAP